MTQGNLPYVMIGAPIHNKVWSIDAYLDHIHDLDYPKDLISIVFFVNDSVDGSKDKLVARVSEWKESGEYRRVEVHEKNYGFIDSRLTHIRKGDSDGFLCVNQDFSHFARVRNAWKGYLLDEAFVFSIDSDVMVPEDSLLRLLDRDVDMVAIPVCNQQNRNDRVGNAEWPDAHYNIMVETRHGYRHWTNFYWDELFEVDLTGACFLAKAKLMRRVDYKPHPIGEDASFCKFALVYGFKIWVDSTMRTNHWMCHPPEGVTHDDDTRRITA